MKKIVTLMLIVLMTMLTGCGTEQKSDTVSSEKPKEVSNMELKPSESYVSNEDKKTQTDKYDFSAFGNVEITGVDIAALNDEQLSVLYRQAKYCQAMTNADIETMAELVAEDVIFTHMTGVKQTRAEYFADVKDGSLRYYTIGIENPEIEVNGDFASIHYTSVLNANAYGARGTYRMEGTHKFEKVNGEWITTNAAQEH